MRGKLTEAGLFIAERKTGFEGMGCPYNDVQCGPWGALFSEPIKKRNIKMKREETLVNLCNGRYWKFTEFEDERPNEQEKTNH